MATNATLGYQLAEQKYLEARTPEEKLIALQKMLQMCPKHKASENLQKNIKERISKLKAELQRDKQTKKKQKGSNPFSVKKEGAAQIVAAELGINFDKERLKISELVQGMKRANVLGKVVETQFVA